MHSLEVLLDPAADAAVRAEWAVLSAAGLPSLGEHTGETNAPHVTLLARPTIDDAADAALAELAAAALPLPVELGAPLVFGTGRRGLVLVRSVVPTDRLLGLHRAVHDLVRHGDDETVEHTRPDAWTPHVALARRLTPAGVATALEALADATAARAAAADEEARVDTGPSRASTTTWLAAARRWDSDRKSVVALGPA
jgi:2'-5' RNA ligase